MNKMVHIERKCQVIGGIVMTVAVILMQGYVIDRLIRMIQRYGFPFRECRHARARASAGNQLDGRVDEPHGFCRLERKPAVLFRRLVSDLPRSIHLVAEAPGLDLVRLFITMAAA